MTEKQKIKYVESIVSGNLPDQNTFTKSEVSYLVMTVITWCVLQIEHTMDELHEKNIARHVKNVGYKSIKEAIKDRQDTYEEEFHGLMEYLTNHLLYAHISNCCKSSMIGGVQCENCGSNGQ